MTDLFCGQLRSVVQCGTCGKTSTCYDPFMDLSLPIPKARDPPTPHSLAHSLTHSCGRRPPVTTPSWTSPSQSQRHATHSPTLTANTPSKTTPPASHLSRLENPRPKAQHPMHPLVSLSLSR